MRKHNVLHAAALRGARGMPLTPKHKVTLNWYMDAYDAVGELIRPLIDNNAVATSETMAAMMLAMDDLQLARHAHFDGVYATRHKIASSVNDSL